jgi:hypothetical protein
MCTVLLVKHVSDSEWPKLQQVGTVEREPRNWLNITLAPNLKVLLNVTLRKCCIMVLFFFSSASQTN